MLALLRGRVVSVLPSCSAARLPQAQAQQRRRLAIPPVHEKSVDLGVDRNKFIGMAMGQAITSAVTAADGTGGAEEPQSLSNVTELAVGKEQRWMLQLTRALDYADAPATVTQPQQITPAEFPVLHSTANQQTLSAFKDGDRAAFWVHLVKVFAVGSSLNEQMQLFIELSRLDRKFHLPAVQMNQMYVDFLHCLRFHPEYSDWLATAPIEDVYRVSVFFHRGASTTWQPVRLTEFVSRFADEVSRSLPVDQLLRYAFVLYRGRALSAPQCRAVEQKLLQLHHRLDAHQAAALLLCLNRSQTYLARDAALLPIVDRLCIRTVHALRQLPLNDDDDDGGDNQEECSSLDERTLHELTLKTLLQHYSYTLLYTRNTYVNISAELAHSLAECPIAQLGTKNWMRVAQLLAQNHSPEATGGQLAPLYSKLADYLSTNYKSMRSKMLYDRNEVYDNECWQDMAQLFRILVYSDLPDLPGLSAFIAALPDELLSDERALELQTFSQAFFQMADVLAEVGCYHRRLIETLMAPDNQKSALAGMQQTSRVNFSCLSLVTRLAVCAPDYAAPRLLPELRQYYADEIERRARALPSVPLTAASVERIPFEWMRLAARRICAEAAFPVDRLTVGWVFPHLTYLHDFILWVDARSGRAMPVTRCRFDCIDSVRQCAVPDNVIGVIVTCVRAKDLHGRALSRLFKHRLLLYHHIGYRLCIVDGNTWATDDRIQAPSPTADFRRQLTVDFSLQRAMAPDYDGRQLLRLAKCTDYIGDEVSRDGWIETVLPGQPRRNSSTEKKTSTELDRLLHVLKSM